MEPNPLASHSAATGDPERATRPEDTIGDAAIDSRRAHDAAPSRSGGALMTAPDLATAEATRILDTPSRYANGHANGHGHGAIGLANGYAPGATPAAWAVGTFAGTREEAPPSLYIRYGKRALDVVGALIGIIVTSPLLGLAALAVKLESRGPVLYKSKRVGRGGHIFTFYKLRSMVNGADRHRHTLSHLNETNGPVFKMMRDPRVTRVGRFLRTTSIDELPQLFNVLSGDMSLVGPRPPLAEEVAQYEPWQLRRLEVRPGITCLWQISGRSRIGFQEWMRLDLEYIRKQSFGLDLRILVRTIPAVLSREGAY